MVYVYYSVSSYSVCFVLAIICKAGIFDSSVDILWPNIITCNIDVDPVRCHLRATYGPSVSLDLFISLLGIEIVPGSNSGSNSRTGPAYLCCGELLERRFLTDSVLSSSHHLMGCLFVICHLLMVCLFGMPICHPLLMGCLFVIFSFGICPICHLLMGCLCAYLSSSHGMPICHLLMGWCLFICHLLMGCLLVTFSWDAYLSSSHGMPISHKDGICCSPFVHTPWLVDILIDLCLCVTG